MTKTYTLIKTPEVTSLEVAFHEPQAIEGIPTDMTFREATALCDQARANGHDVIVFNTQAQ